MSLKTNFARLSLFYLLGFASQFSFSASIQEQMIQDLDVVNYHMSIKYAPKEWKKEHLGWSLEQAYENAKLRIIQENPSTPLEYQKILSQFLSSTRDYHVNISYYATAWSFFPLKVKKVGQSYYIGGLDTSIAFTKDELQFNDLSTQELIKIAKKVAQFAIGDEIIKIDGRSIQEVIEELIDTNLYGDRTHTGYETAVRNLFFRKASMGHFTPKAQFKITVKNQLTNELVTYEMSWIHAPEMIPNHLLKDPDLTLKRKAKPAKLKNSRVIEHVLAKDFSVARVRELSSFSLQCLLNDLQIESAADKNFPNRARDLRAKGFLPALGYVVWESPKNKSLYAYLYQHPSTKQLIGYIYLPTFGKSGEEAGEYLNEIMDVIQVFNQRATGLVFDITDNTGGDVLFMYGLLSVLTDTPLQLPVQQEILVQEDIQKKAFLYEFFKNLAPFSDTDTGENLSGYPVTNTTIEQIKEYSSTLLRLWEEGETFTPPLHLFGINEIEPHPYVCLVNKPIIVLVNSCSLSCGDYFPAILQDNQKALIFGEKTGGAGGYVNTHSHTSRFGVQAYSLTGSITYRLDGTPLENLGVTPDKPCSITLSDIRNDYVNYINQVNLEMKKLAQ